MREKIMIECRSENFVFMELETTMIPLLLWVLIIACVCAFVVGYKIGRKRCLKN